MDVPHFKVVIAIASIGVKTRCWVGNRFEMKSEVHDSVHWNLIILSKKAFVFIKAGWISMFEGIYLAIFVFELNAGEAYATTGRILNAQVKDCFVLFEFNLSRCQA
jgi:hypothetical protein